MTSTPDCPLHFHPLLPARTTTADYLFFRIISGKPTTTGPQKVHLLEASSGHLQAHLSVFPAVILPACSDFTHKYAFRRPDAGPRPGCPIRPAGAIRLLSCFPPKPTVRMRCNRYFPKNEPRHLHSSNFGVFFICPDYPILTLPPWPPRTVKLAGAFS